MKKNALKVSKNRLTQGAIMQHALEPGQRPMHYCCYLNVDGTSDGEAYLTPRRQLWHHSLLGVP